MIFLIFKQKTAYEMRISDWSSDVCSSDLQGGVTSGDGWSYSTQGGMSSFELDLFGKLQNATEAQRNTALSTEASARTVRLGLVANLALAWAAYAADKDLLSIAQSTVANAENSVRLTQASPQGGEHGRTASRERRWQKVERR